MKGWMIKERAHSKYSASGAERWFSCPGSIALSEGMPDKSSDAAKEGTQAHKVLESLLTLGDLGYLDFPIEMRTYGVHAAKQVHKVLSNHMNADLMLESRVTLEFIHPEAFGSLDVAILDYFGTLHIMDYKYGMQFVSPVENLQFLFYALAVAYKHYWNFSKVRMWTLQPRVRGFDGNYPFWEITMAQLKGYIEVFQKAVARVERFPNKYVEGNWCFFCKARSICPLKTDKKKELLIKAFNAERD